MSKPVEAKRERVTTSAVERNWNLVAPAWDARVEEIEEQSAAATAALLARAAPEAGDRVLELGAGPGALGPTLSQLVGPAGDVVVSDIARGMVDVARRRNETLSNVEIAVLDASAIDRPDECFDVVVCRMSLMFTLDPTVAVAEIRRVLRPGGRFATLTWAGMEHNPWMTCVGLAASAHGLTEAGPPIGRGEVFSLGDEAALRALVENGGFGDVGSEAHEFAFRAPDIESHIEQIAALAGPLALAVRTSSVEQLAALRDTAAKLAARYVTDDGVVLPGRALLVWGRKPPQH